MNSRKPRTNRSISLNFAPGVQAASPSSPTTPTTSKLPFWGRRDSKLAKPEIKPPKSNKKLARQDSKLSRQDSKLSRQGSKSAKRNSLKKRKTSTENHMDDSRTRIRQTDDRDRCTNCLRGVLHCYNVFILILGCGALAVGIWYLVTEYSAREVSVVVGEEWFEVATYLLIGAGGTIALLAFCGCCGTMREDKCVLGFYSGTLTFMFLFLTVSCGMAFYFRRQVGIILTKDIVKHMTDTIEHQYGLDTRTNSNNKLVTDAWDSLQRQLQCCGIQGGENSSFSWSVYKLRSEWYRRNPDQFPYVPSSCCKKNANEKRCTGVTRMRAPPAIGPPLGREDLRNPDLNTEGCLDKIREHLLERAIILGLVAGSIPILLAVGIVVSCCLCLKVRRNAEDEEIDL